MKVKLIIKIFYLFSYLLVFNSAIFAQEIPVAVRIAEYDDKTEKIETFAEKTNLFLDKLSKSPQTTMGFIAVFGKDYSTYKVLSEKVASIISKNPNLKSRVETFIPGVRYRETDKSDYKSEFWLIPEGAESPYTPFCINCLCPTISVSGTESISNETSAITFTANVSGGSQDDGTYNWKVSAGKIIEGQGTAVIKVDAEGAKEITATVEIGGVCEECNREASFRTKIQ